MRAAESAIAGVVIEPTATLFAAVLALTAGCGRFGNEKNTGAHGEQIIVTGQRYNEILWDLGAQQDVVGVDFSSTFPPAVKKVQTVGYHRAFSAEGIPPACNEKSTAVYVTQTRVYKEITAVYGASTAVCGTETAVYVT